MSTECPHCAPLIAENERLKDANCWSCEDKEKIRKLTEQNRELESIVSKRVPKLEKILSIMKEVLTEAWDWVCPHTEAAETFKKSGPRVWCNDCSQYLRSEADATISKRIGEALAKCAELETKWN